MYPLDGVVVVDISRLAITFVSRLLTDMGAATVSVHPPANTAGRLTTPYSIGGDPPTVAPTVDKLHTTLDLKLDADREKLYTLVRCADVFIEGYRPGVAGRLGCSYERIRAVKPDIIYASVTGYGQTGERASDPGHDINYVSVAGVLDLVRTPDGQQAIPMNIIADMAGGMYGALTVASALARRNAGGGGAYLDVSLTEGVATLAGGLLDAALEPGAGEGEHFWPRNRSRAEGGQGMLGGDAPFYRVYTCSDGHALSVGCIESQFWAAQCAVTGLTDLQPDQLDESKWAAMSEAFEKVFGERTRPEWIKAFEGADTCVTPVLTPSEAARDPHLHGRRLDGIWAGGRVQTAEQPTPRSRPLELLKERGCPSALLSDIHETPAT